MEKRKYGKQGDFLSIIGFAGIIVMNETQKDANDYVAEAIDNGVNYFDVAPSYGNAEERLGPALKEKRNDVFLACKTEERSAKEAENALIASLKKLKTDHFDLYQLHAVTTKEDVDTIMGKDGCIEFFEAAKKKGLIRHIGFSAHSEEAAISLMEQYDFDSVLFPLNFVNVHNDKFGLKILEEASKRGITKLALKAMALTNWGKDEEKKYPKCWYKPIDDYSIAKLALKFTLSKDVTAAITPGHMELFRMAVDIASDIRQLNPEEEESLKKISQELNPIF